jgi:hypothetical protein
VQIGLAWCLNWRWVRGFRLGVVWWKGGCGSAMSLEELWEEGLLGGKVGGDGAGEGYDREEWDCSWWMKSYT